VIKPHHSTALSALIFLCSAVCFAVAGREPRAATAFGAALIAGVAALAMYLNERQRFALSSEQRSEVKTLTRAGRITAAVRQVREGATTDTRSAYRYVRRLDASYTSHSRA